MKRVVFMGTPEFAVPSLEALAKRFEVVGVYTQPDKPVGRGQELRPTPIKAKALELGIPVFQPLKLSLPGEFEKLQELRPDVIVVVAYGQILRRNVLDLPPLGCVNVHSSLLPRWRGAAPIQWAILAGDSETGVCTQRMAEKLDAGEVLMSARTPISSEETAGTLHDRLSLMGATLVVPTVEGLIAGTLPGQVQDESQVTYASKLTKEMERLDWEKASAVELDRQVRALNPWPGTRLMTESGERLKVKRARARNDVSGTVGTLFERAGMVCLGTRDGALECLSLQWDGKREVDGAGFVNGLKGRGQGLPLRLKKEQD